MTGLDCVVMCNLKNIERERDVHTHTRLRSEGKPELAHHTQDVSFIQALGDNVEVLGLGGSNFVDRRGFFEQIGSGHSSQKV